MSYVREKFVSTGILVVGLCLSPVAFGQAQASAEPQLQDQSAPQDQSLGAVARQAKAQKAKSEPAKVYTEDKLAGLSGRGVSSVGSGNSGGGASYGGNSYNNAAASGGGG